MINNYVKLLTEDEQTYYNIEKTLINEFKNQVINKSMINKESESGLIVDLNGKTFNQLFVCIKYEYCQKKYDLSTALKSKFLSFENSELHTLYTTYYNLHNEITNRYNEIKAEEAQRLLEKQKLEEEQLKAEEAYERIKNNTIKSFENYINKEKTTNNYSSDFYYGLGWLVKNVKNITATLPDYLERAFRKHFGIDVPCRVTNSKHRGPSGYQSQWSWSFSLTLNNIEDIPSMFIEYLNPKKTAITNTSFIWDLIDTYNFKFGKTQDIDSIISSIPKEYQESFNLGFSMI